MCNVLVLLTLCVIILYINYNHFHKGLQKDVIGVCLESIWGCGSSRPLPVEVASLQSLLDPLWVSLTCSNHDFTQVFGSEQLRALAERSIFGAKIQRRELFRVDNMHKSVVS